MKMILKGGGVQRLVNLHPLFFSKDNKKPISERVHDFAHDTQPLISDIVIRKGIKVEYERHYANPETGTLKVFVGKTEGQKQVAKMLKAEHKRTKLKIINLTDILI